MSLALAADDRPYLPRGVRVIEDKVRGGKVLLAPEKAIALDAIGDAILQRVTGAASFAEIVASLAETYNAPVEQISTDVQRFMIGLRARMYLRVHP